MRDKSADSTECTSTLVIEKMSEKNKEKAVSAELVHTIRFLDGKEKRGACIEWGMVEAEKKVGVKMRVLVKAGWKETGKDTHFIYNLPLEVES